MFFYNESDSEVSQVQPGATDEHFDNVVLLLPMSTDFSDSSSHNHTVNTVGDTSIVGSSGDFDGSGDYITVSSPELAISANQAVTIEFDLRFDSRASAGAALFDYGIHNSVDDLTFLCQTNINGWQITPWMPNVYNWDGSTMVDGSWHHVAFTRTSDGSWYSFVDGSIVQSGTGATGAIASNGVLRINGLQNYAGYEFNGGMKNFRITKGVARYTSAFTPPTSHPEQGEPAPTDPNFSNVSLLMPMDSDFSDSSTFSHTVTANGNATIDTNDSKYGAGSTYFDGTDYLTVPRTTELQFGTGDFTIEGWINLDQYSSTRPAIFSNYSAWGSHAVSIFAGHSAANSTKYQVAIGGTFPAIQSSVSVQYNAWIHFALTREAGTVRLFINGNEEGSTIYTGAADGQGTNVYLGISGDTIAKGGITGNIDDFRITKGVARYTTNFTPPTEAHPTS